MVPFPVYHYVSGHSGVLKDVPGTSMLSPAHFAILLLLYSSWRKVEVTCGGSFTHVWPHVSLLLTSLVTEKQSPWPFWLLKLSEFAGGWRVVSSEHTCMWIGVDDGVSWREWIRRFILENWARATATRPTLFLTFVICKKREKKQNIETDDDWSTDCKNKNDFIAQEKLLCPNNKDKISGKNLYRPKTYLTSLLFDELHHFYCWRRAMSEEVFCTWSVLRSTSDVVDRVGLQTSKKEKKSQINSLFQHSSSPKLMSVSREFLTSKEVSWDKIS